MTEAMPFLQKYDITFLRPPTISGDVLFSLYDKNFLHDIMSTKEKQATPKAAFVFLVPLANEQPA